MHLGFLKASSRAYSNFDSHLDMIRLGLDLRVNNKGTYQSAHSGSLISSLVIRYLEKGAQWLSGRVLCSRPRGRGFGRHCVVVLEQDSFILA